MKVTDEQLMLNYLSGDHQAFEELYRRHSSKVYGYLHKRVSSESERDDLFQKVWMKFHHSRETYDHKHQVLNWIFVICRSTWVDYLRQKKRQPGFDASVDLEEIPEEPKYQHEASVESVAMDHLSAEQKKIVEMRVVDELSYADIAARIKKSEASIRQIFSRAVRKLKGAHG